MAFTEAQNFAIVQTELDEVFFPEFDYDAQNPMIQTARTGDLFKVTPTTHAAYITETFKGSGLFPKIGETQTVPESTPHVANKMTTYPAVFAQGITISKDLFDDNMHGVWAASVQDFALKARLSQDENAFKLFRNSFTTSLTADGVSIINASHPLIGGGTVSNIITGALTPTTLNTAMVTLREMKDQTNTIIGTVGEILLVPSALWKHAKEITESALLADGGNNNLNVWRSAYGIKIYSSPYLGASAGGSDTAWWLLARNHSVRRLVRQGVETNLRDWGMSNNRTYYYQANFREEVFCTDYAGIVGSLGT